MGSLFPRALHRAPLSSIPDEHLEILQCADLLRQAPGSLYPPGIPHPPLSLLPLVSMLHTCRICDRM